MDRRLLSFLPSNNVDPAIVDEFDHYNDAFILDFDISNPPSPLADSDNDGMPDYWEVSHGLNSSTQDHNGTSLSNSITGINGYTNLECYINCLSDYLVSGATTIPCGITGVAGINTKLNLEETVFVYPNPSRGKFTVMMPKTASQLQILNSIGQVIYRTAAENQISKEISIEENAVYFIEIKMGDATVNKKIIVCD